MIRIEQGVRAALLLALTLALAGSPRATAASPNNPTIDARRPLPAPAYLPYLNDGDIWLVNLVHSRELAQPDTFAIKDLLDGLESVLSHSSPPSSVAIQKV